MICFLGTLGCLKSSRLSSVFNFSLAGFMIFSTLYRIFCTGSDVVLLHTSIIFGDSSVPELSGDCWVCTVLPVLITSEHLNDSDSSFLCDVLTLCGDGGSCTVLVVMLSYTV